MTTPQDDDVQQQSGSTDDADRAHAEEPAEGGTGSDGGDTPREHSEDPAEG